MIVETVESFRSLNLQSVFLSALCEGQRRHIRAPPSQVLRHFPFKPSICKVTAGTGRWWSWNDGCPLGLTSAREGMKLSFQLIRWVWIPHGQVSAVNEDFVWQVNIFQFVKQTKKSIVFPPPISFSSYLRTNLQILISRETARKENSGSRELRAWQKLLHSILDILNASILETYGLHFLSKDIHV